MLNGIYLHDPQTNTLRFLRVPAPTTEEVATLVDTIATRAERTLARQGFSQGS